MWRVRFRNMTAEEYAEYLRTPHWLATRKVALERAERRCQVCNGSKLLQVHHRTYERIGAELPGDLTVLCDDCHGVFHDIAHDGREPVRWETVAAALLGQRVVLSVYTKLCTTTTVGILIVTDRATRRGREYAISQRGKWPVGVVSKASFYPEQFTEVWLENSWGGRTVYLKNNEREVGVSLSYRPSPVVRSKEERRKGRITTEPQERFIRNLRLQLDLQVDAPITSNRDDAAEEIRRLLEIKDTRTLSPR